MSDVRGAGGCVGGVAGGAGGAASEGLSQGSPGHARVGGTREHRRAEGSLTNLQRPLLRAVARPPPGCKWLLHGAAECAGPGRATYGRARSVYGSSGTARGPSDSVYEIEIIGINGNLFLWREY